MRMRPLGTPGSRNANVHRFRPVFALLAFLVLLCGALSGPAARAEEMPPPVKMLFQVFRLKLDLQPRARLIRPDGDGYELQDVVFAEGALDDETRFTVTARRILLRGTAMRDGLMLYRHIRVEDLQVAFTDADGHFRAFVPRADFAEVSILSPQGAHTDVEKFASGNMFSAATSIPEIRFEVSGFEPFYWRGIRVTWEGDRRTGAGEQRLEYGTLKIPLAELLKASKRHGKALDRNYDEEVLVRRLGLKEFIMTGYGESTSTWLPDNRLQTDATSIMRFERIGEISFSLDDLAMPLELLQGLEEMQRQRMAAGPGAVPPDAALMQRRLMASLQRLTLLGLDVRWRDLGLTPALLDLAAEREGVGRKALIDRLERDLTAKLAQAPIPQLARQLTAAFVKFLREPKSLHVGIRGANGQPVALAGLVSLLLISPQMLMNSVEIVIEANE